MSTAYFIGGTRDGWKIEIEPEYLIDPLKVPEPVGYSRDVKREHSRYRLQRYREGEMTYLIYIEESLKNPMGHLLESRAKYV